MSLKGKRALVTGASRGIGAAIVEELRHLGAEVLAVSRTGDMSFDLSQPQEIHRLAQQVGPLDILVNNAGMSNSSPFHKLTWEDWKKTQALNVDATMLCSQAFLPAMKKAGWGRIVNVASVAGLTGGRYISAYTASKHAVMGLTRALAAEMAPHGVTVNAVCPGFVETPMTEQTVSNIVKQTGRPAEEARKILADLNPQGRLLEAEEVAFAVGFLCQPRARGINGQALVIDGGGFLA